MQAPHLRAARFCCVGGDFGQRATKRRRIRMAIKDKDARDC
jgi:hypothetical protein